MTPLSLLPILVVSLLYGIVGTTPVAVGLALLALASTVISRRLAWPRGTQLLVGVPLFVVLLIGLATLFPQPSGAVLELRTPWRAVAGAALGLAVLRLYFAEPWGGEPITLMLQIVALTACGGTLRSDLYPIFVVAFVASAAIARRAADSGRAPLAEALRARLGAAIGLLLVAATLLSLAIVVLPPMHRHVVEQLMRRATMPTTGFSERMWLGSLRGMLESDQRVLRIRGDAGGALLRGVVLDHYVGARWTHTEEFATVEPPSSPLGGAVEIEILDPEPERYFLPQPSEAIAVSSGIARVDATGVLAPIAAEPATRVWYRPGSSHAYPVKPPTPNDTALPAAVLRGLEPFARDFTAGAGSVEAKLTALENALQTRNHYSLEVPWSGREDPIVAFVREGRGGHCEYFATAMALLSRSLGIPARVVGGYRVVEKNPIGDYYIVRERDAHAWVEAWIPGRGWVTFDPTPPAATRAETPLLPALWDAAGTLWLALLEWLDRRTPLEMVVPPILLIVLALALRATRRHRPRVSRAGPPAFFLDVCRALGGRGIARRPSDTPNALARRVATTLPTHLAEPAKAFLERYAAWRYGGHGEHDDLVREAAELTQLLERRE